MKQTTPSKAGLLRIKALFKKEIRDILRDRKTLLIMVFLPIVLYPLMMIGGIAMSSLMTGSGNNSNIVIGAPKELLSTVYEITESKKDSITIINTDNSDKACDIYLAEQDSDTDDIRSFILEYDSSNTFSMSAMNTFSDLFDQYREKQSMVKLEDLGLDAKLLLHPVTIQFESTASIEETTGSLFGSIIPFLLIVGVLSGAIYPAIDTTAGEKERKTLETLMTLPVSNFELIFSKFLAVCLVAVVSALLNILSIGASMGIMMGSIVDSGLISIEAFQFSGFIPAIIMSIICMIIFSMFISVVTLGVCMNTSSFKEAQNISTPVLLVVIMGSFIGVIPGFELTKTTAIIPIVNITLLIRDMFSFKFVMEYAIIVLLSNLIYTGALLYLVSKFYHSESVLFGDNNGGTGFFEKRALIVKKEKKVPSTGDLIVVTLVCLMLILTIGQYAQVHFPIWGLAVTQLICIGIPVFAAWYGKNDLKYLFSLKIQKQGILLRIPAAICLWLGSFILLNMLSNLLIVIFPQDQASLELMDSYLKEIPPALLFIEVGILPAICEEILFRGYIFKSLNKRFGKISAIIVSSCVFGLYHMSLVKLIPTAMLGACSAFAITMGGSIFLAMLMHGLNNTIAVLTMIFPEQFERIIPFVSEQGMSPMQTALFLMIGIGLVAIGIFLFVLQNKKIANTNE